MTTSGRWSLVPALAVVLLTTACTTTAPVATQPEPETPPPLVADDDSQHWRWEEETRAQADALVKQARALADEGRLPEALHCVDSAIAIVLTTPPGYHPRQPYLDYLAQLLDEAESIEAVSEPCDVLPQPEGELVVLPEVDLGEDPVATAILEADRHILPDSDMPLQLNPTVEGFLEAFTEAGEFRTRIEVGLGRAGTYLPMIRERLKEAGLPQDLAFLPLIESAFSRTARSHARAHGMWQFIASTGRHYGLEIDALIDERRDPVRSTEAAVAHLDDLFAEFGDWYLALAAYNSGAGNVRRAIRRSSSRDFWTLRRHLPRETRNYVPAFIASVIVAKRPDRYGMPAIKERPWQLDRIDVPDALDLQFLASRLDLPVDILRDLNPAICKDLTPPGRSTPVWLPPGMADAASEVLATVARTDWAPRLIYTVRRGDSLYTIARRHGSSVSALRAANGLRSNLIRPGQNLVVPRLGLASTAASRSRRTGSDGTYVVQRSDSLWAIAHSFAVPLSTLCAANNLEPGGVIHPGQRLSIPQQQDKAPTLHPSASTSTYRVRRGDTLYAIARRFGTSVAALRRANGLASSRIHPGDLLRIPQG